MVLRAATVSSSKYCLENDRFLIREQVYCLCMKLLEPFDLGPFELRNRVVMAPMTRSRATPEGLATELMTTYYEQRATMGLLVSEGINISEQAVGSPFTPSLYTDAQTAAWRTVTSAVHAAGGRIFAQLWHTGRVGHSSVRGG
jgi:N-ethylmaleimide reductase